MICAAATEFFFSFFFQIKLLEFLQQYSHSFLKIYCLIYRVVWFSVGGVFLYTFWNRDFLQLVTYYHIVTPYLKFDSCLDYIIYLKNK